MKDPAILFYWNDWQGGTITFSRHLKGCYMDLLHAQFNIGHLSLEEIRTVLGQDQASWTVLSKKFKQDENGLFYNERMEAEKIKRSSYSESRRKNVSKRYEKENESTCVDTHVKHMNLHMENENENIKEKEKGGVGEKEKEKEQAIKNNKLSTAFIPRPDIKMLIEYWIEYRRKIKKALKTQMGLETFHKQLLEMSGGNFEKAKMIIDQSVANEWQGIFPLKNKQNGGNSNNFQTGNNSTEQREQFIINHAAGMHEEVGCDIREFI